MSTFSLEQLNYFKFATVVLDEFPTALRKVFVHLWDTNVAPTPGFMAWDDSLLVRNKFLSKEGGKTKSVPTNKSYKEWDCTALFEATLYAQSFALPVPGGKGKTLADQYVKPHSLPSGVVPPVFHPSVTSPSGNNDETLALALDQLRRLRNSLCHKSSSKIMKKTFDQYIQLSKDAFAALGQSSTRIDDIGKLAEGDFPTARVQQLELELRQEKLRAIEDGIYHIEDQVKVVASGMTNVTSEVEDVKKEVNDVGLQVKDIKTEVLDTRTKVEKVESDVKNVNTGMEDVRATVEDVGAHVKDVKTGLGDVTTSVKDVGSNVNEMKAGVVNVNKNMDVFVTEVKTVLTDVRTEMDELKASVKDMKLANEAVRSKGHVVPESCVPNEIPHFYGRQKECEAILGHLTGSENIRLVDIWGSPGFGKTSVAINIAHRLLENRIPVYFVCLQGMRSKDELVSKLLSIFADVKQAPHLLPSHWLIQCLRQVQNPFVLILDNADDLLESGDTKTKEEVLKLTEDMLAEIFHIKILFTTRESLDYLGYRVALHLEKVGKLDERSSASLVEVLLPDVSKDNCRSIVKECGQVPLAMQLMCSSIREEDLSCDEVLEELKHSPIVQVLDNESYSDAARLKNVINRSFLRLGEKEKEAFVSLAVFPGTFGLEEASAVLHQLTESERTTRSKRILKSLERKSLIENNKDVGSFSIHPLLRSFVVEKTISDDKIRAVFHTAQLCFYDYNISSFEKASEMFLTGYSNDAFEVFVRQREKIVLSLLSGAREDALYDKTVHVLSKAEFFLFSVLYDEELLYIRLYDAAIEEAKKRNHWDGERKLLAAKYCGCLGWFYDHEQNEHHPLQGSFTDDSDCPPKLLCCFGFFHLLHGKIQEGISFLERFVHCASTDHDENALKILAYHVLAVCFRKQEKDEMASLFETVGSEESKASSLSRAFCSLFLKETPSSSKESNFHCVQNSVAEPDAFIFGVIADLLPPLYKALGDQMKLELSTPVASSLLRMHKGLLVSFKEGRIPVRVMETCCNALHRLACYQEAAEGFHMTTAQLENDRGNHEDTARNYHALGLAQSKLKEYEAAHCSFKRALEIQRNLLQEMTESALDKEVISLTVALLTSFVEVFENTSATTGDVDNFLAACEELEGIVVKSKGDDFAKHIGTLGSVYNNLSNCFRANEDYDKTLMLIGRAKKLTKEHLGDCVQTAKVLTNEGEVYMKMKRYEKAQKSYRRALDLRKKLGIENHEDTAFICHGIGKILFERGKYDDSLNAHLQGLRIRKKHLGDDHLLTASSLDDLGFHYYKMGKYEKAAKKWSKVVKLKRMLNGIPQDTALCFHNLSEVYVQMEKNSDALSACQQAVDIRLDIMPEHVDTATELHLLGSIQFKMAEFKAAVRSFRQASKLRSNLLSDSHQDTALSYHCLGESQHALGDSSGALESLLTASAIRNEILGYHSLTADTEELLGRTYKALGEHDLSSEHIGKALEIRELCEKTVFGDPSDPLLGSY